MDRLISLEPSNVVPIRIEAGQRCFGEVTLRNVMYTMPVAFRLQPVNKSRYSIRPQSGIISPLDTIVVEITYHLSPNSCLPDSTNIPHCEDSFLLHSIVVPGATVKDHSHDSVPNEWFTTRKKQVFIDSGLQIIFVGSSVLCELISGGFLDEARLVFEKSNLDWKAADSIDSEGNTLLHLAIAQYRPDLVQLILEFEPNVETLSVKTGTNPLEEAAALGDALIVELLLAHQATTERSENSKWGPIHFASNGGHIEILKLLQLKGADLNSLTRDENTALHISVEKRRKDCVRFLLTNGAKPNDCNRVDGNTPLHIAASLGDGNIVKLLLQKGSNKDIRNKIGKTAYDLAVENGHTRLLDPLGLADRLCGASRKGEIRSIQKLLDNGAAINTRDQNGWTALHRVSFKGRLDSVRCLIEKGADVNSRDEDGYTPLHCAVESGQIDVIEVLIKNGAEIDARTKKGISGLRLAEMLNYSGVVRVLIQNGANKDGQDYSINEKVQYCSSLQEMEFIAVKKKGNRGRTFRSSNIDRSMQIAVL